MDVLAEEPAANSGMAEREDRPVETSPRPKAERRQRLAVDLTPEAYSRLVEIQQQLRLRSAADVARAAFELLSWYAEQRKEGFSIRLVKDGRTKDVELLFLGP